MTDLTSKYYHLFDRFDSDSNDFRWRPDLSKAYVKDDGRVYCGVCHKAILAPRPEALVKLTGCNEGMIPVVCDCYKKLESEYEAKEEAKRIQDRIYDLSEMSLMGEKYKNAKFSEFDMDVDPTIQNAKLRAEKYCESASECLKRNLGIYFYGMSGLGKTAILACMANSLMSKLYSVKFTSLSSIIKMMKDKNAEHDVMKDIEKVDFLFLDDIGTENIDQWDMAKIYTIINTRYNAKRPTLFSSNYTLKELLENKGFSGQTINRIGEMATVVIMMRGECYRKQILKESKESLPF